MDDIKNLMGTTLLSVGNVSLTLGQLLSVLLFVMLGGLFVIWSTGFLRRRLAARKINPDIVHLLGRAYLVLGFIVLGFMTLDFLQIPLAAFAFISGAVAIGVGFGAQNIINNFISGWILMWERPIKIGDFLEMGDVRGNVESINTRSTLIRRPDGVHQLVPNSYLLENTVTNWTLVDKMMRASVNVGVAYGSDVGKVTDLLQCAATEHADVLDNPPPRVIFDDFGDNALAFVLNVWVLAQSDTNLRGIRSDLRYRIDALFRENGVVIAFPQRDIHLDGELTLRKTPAGADQRN